MSDKSFRRLGQFIHEQFGIKMPESKKIMLQGRLRKRLRALEMDSFDQYCDFVLSPAGQQSELFSMIDLVSTNKTDFFREASHFDYLVTTVLPELGSRVSGKVFNIWSAGCSSGEEPYTLAMVLSDYIERHAGFQFSILATDISNRVLQAAKTAVYSQEKVEPVPADLKRKYLMKSKDRSKKIVRIVPELRERIRFQRLNFMDDDFGLRQRFDAIFCRNVIIYFDSSTQEALLSKFCYHLKPGGYLFLGHSESVHEMELPLVQAAPTVHRRVQ